VVELREDWVLQLAKKFAGLMLKQGIGGALNGQKDRIGQGWDSIDHGKRKTERTDLNSRKLKIWKFAYYFIYFYFLSIR
jgi:hypothetical protein